VRHFSFRFVLLFFSLRLARSCEHTTPTSEQAANRLVSFGGRYETLDSLGVLVAMLVLVFIGFTLSVLQVVDHHFPAPLAAFAAPPPSLNSTAAVFLPSRESAHAFSRSGVPVPRVPDSVRVRDTPWLLLLLLLVFLLLILLSTGIWPVHRVASVRQEPSGAVRRARHAHRLHARAPAALALVRLVFVTGLSSRRAA
jgi:hypothetical protein